MIDPGKGETHAAARQAGERDLELERLAHQSGGAAGGGSDRHVLEQEIRRWKESDVDRAGDDDRRADDRAELRLDLPAMARPINEQRRDQRRRQRHDQQNGDEREKMAHFCEIDRMSPEPRRNRALVRQHGLSVAAGQAELSPRLGRCIPPPAGGNYCPAAWPDMSLSYAGATAPSGLKWAKA